MRKTYFEDFHSIAFEGTGINYSWYFKSMDALFEAPTVNQKDLYLISGSVYSYFIIWARNHNMLKWDHEDFKNWNHHSKVWYGTGFWLVIKIILKKIVMSDKPIFRREQTMEALKDAFLPEFLVLRMKDLPDNIKIPLLRIEDDKVVIADAVGELSEMKVVDVILAATAIPGLFPNILFEGSNYSDPAYCKGIIHKIIKIQDIPCIRVYSLFKSNARGNINFKKVTPESYTQRNQLLDNLRFLFGVRINSYVENVKNIFKTPRSI